MMTENISPFKSWVLSSKRLVLMKMIENICAIAFKGRFLFSIHKGLPGFAGKGAEKDCSKERNSCGSFEKGFYIFQSYDLPILTIINLEQEEEASSTSSSSEEGLLCVFSDSETSSEEKVVKSSRQSNRAISNQNNSELSMILRWWMSNLLSLHGL